MYVLSLNIYVTEAKTGTTVPLAFFITLCAATLLLDAYETHKF